MQGASVGRVERTVGDVASKILSRTYKQVLKG